MIGLLRSGMRRANRVAGVLMVVVGAYVAWYGVFALRVRDDPTTSGGPADLVDRWSRSATEFIDRTGASRLGLILAGAIVAMICISVIVSSLRKDRPS